MRPLPDCDTALNTFVRVIGEVFPAGLVSVLLHGSYVFDDLAPGYGDLDFVAVVADDVREEQCVALVDARARLRAEAPAPFGGMIEGAFLPRRMLDPAVAGDAFWWGTSGDRRWEKSLLGWFVLEVIRERGEVIFGADVRTEIPPAAEQDLLGEVRTACETAMAHGKGGSTHSVDWLLTAARMLYWLRERRLSSKSEAADWASSHARGGWRELLPRAKMLRLYPEAAAEPGAAQWLESLTPTIQEAWAEVQREAGN